MGILDLPLELFRQIVEDIVLRGHHHANEHDYFHNWGNKDIISLSQVNTVFEREVFLILVKRKFLTHEKSMPPVGYEPLIHDTTFLARYILIRPYEPGATSFPAFVNLVVDKLLEPECLCSNAKVRYECLKTLCFRVISLSLKTSSPDSIPSVPPWSDLLVAAIYLGKHSWVDSYLEKNPRVIADMKSRFWGRPLYAAIQMESIPIICRLLRLGAGQGLDARGEERSCLEVAVHTHLAEKIVPNLFEPEWDWYCWPYQDSVDKAIYEAVKLGKVNVANILLSHRRRRLMLYPSRDDSENLGHINSALEEACKRGMTNIVVRLINAGGRVNERRIGGGDRSELALIACRAGHEGVLKALLHRGAIVHGDKLRHDYIMAAAKRGYVGIARILVGAGETLKPIEALKILQITAPRPHTAEVVWYLLQCGAINPRNLDRAEILDGTRVAYCMIAAAQRGNSGFIEALSRYGIPIDDEDYYTEADCPLPIVAALAFRQDAMVQSLKELGVRDADPMKSIIARHFRSGLYPCVPTPLIDDDKDEGEYFWYRI